MNPVEPQSWRQGLVGRCTDVGVRGEYDDLAPSAEDSFLGYGATRP